MFPTLIGTVVIAGITGYLSEKSGFTRNGILSSIIICIGGAFLFYFITIMFGIAAAVAGLAGVMYGPINPPNYHMGMDFLVLSFVVVVVGGMGSLPGAVLAGFLLGILESFASTTWATTTIPGINQIIIYLVAIIVLLTRPRGLMGRKGVMED